jgi:hypothetical protein
MWRERERERKKNGKRQQQGGNADNALVDNDICAITRKKLKGSKQNKNRQ